MKLNYTLLLSAALLAAGCSKPPANGNVASNSDGKSATTTSTTGATTGSGDATATTSTTGTATPPSTSAGGDKATPPPAGTPSSGSGAPAPGAKGVTSKPGSAVSPPPAAGAQPGGPPTQPGMAGAQTKMTPEQQKEMQAKIEAAKKKMAENGAKADKAEKSALDGVNGVYKAVVDESKIPAQVKAQPGYADQLAKAKANPPSLTIGKDGTITIKGLGPTDVSGFTTKIDGKPAVVVTNPHPQPGMPSKQFVPVTISNGGSTIVLGPGGPTFKRG
ncbi:MAG TPA: hypothetical protein VKT78_19630 [Fimbriimonadaceae bacterium]|nr:hypothetical protein [Fimbriimonadaceae bacterium]